jgi:hypothetical protein
VAARAVQRVRLRPDGAARAGRVHLPG